MSTRANIIIKGSRPKEKIYFYRHSDGYPEWAYEKSLKKFCDMYKKQLRHNVSQSAGWLILFGAVEYGFKGDLNDPKGNNNKYEWNNWKVGAYEITTDIHGDIEYLYVIDLEEQVLKCYKVSFRILDKPDAEEQILNSKPLHTYSFKQEKEEGHINI